MWCNVGVSDSKLRCLGIRASGESGAVVVFGEVLLSLSASKES